MTSNEDILKLEDVISKELFGYILNMLSHFVGCASIGMSREGEFTNEINFTNFCGSVMRNSELGRKACEKCDMEHCLKCELEGEAKHYKCHAGLIDATVPIFDGDNAIGSIVFGQVLFEEPDLEFCKQKAKEYGIDEQQYIDAIKEIPIVDETKFREAIKQMENLCQTISSLAKSKRLEAHHQQKDDFVIALLNSVINKRNWNHTLHILVDEVAKLFNADRVILIDYTIEDQPSLDIDYFRPDTLKEEDIEAIRNAEQEEWVKEACKKSYLITKGIIYDFDSESGIDPELKTLYKGFGLKSSLAKIIKTKDFSKFLLLESYTKTVMWTEKDQSFLGVIGKEVAMALNYLSMSKELEHQINMFDTIINNLPFEVMMKNPLGQFIDVNNVFLKNKNMKRSEIIGNVSENILSKNDQKISDEITNQVLEDKAPCYIEFQEGHGTTKRWKRVEVVPIYDKNGNMDCSVACMYDIHDRKTIEKIKADFISTVSHELRTKLTSVMGGLGLALSGEFGEIPQKIKTVLDISHKNSKRLLEIIKDLLDIEKLSTGQIEYEYEVVELCRHIDDAIKQLEAFAKRYNININYDVDVCGTQFLKVDKSRFTQILTNLLSNAIKYSDKGKDVEIYTDSLPTDKIRISVVNYGPEVPKDLKDKIYDRYAQADTSIIRKDSTGLGLNITQKLVTDMGGTIDFNSKNGKTIFYVEFDKAEKSA